MKNELTRTEHSILNEQDNISELIVAMLDRGATASEIRRAMIYLQEVIDVVRALTELQNSKDVYAISSMFQKYPILNENNE